MLWMWEIENGRKRAVQRHGLKEKRFEGSTSADGFCVPRSSRTRAVILEDMCFTGCVRFLFGGKNEEGAGV